MGFTFRKSIKIGKNTRINLSSKGGVGISTGVKGARISTNKQGTRIYGGVGPLRYQKKISGGTFTSANNVSKIDNSTYEYTGDNEPKENKFMALIKKYYKEIIAVIIGILVGSGIGGIGTVSSSLSDSITNEIQQNDLTLQSKQSELKELNKSIEDLEKLIKN